MNCVIYQHDSDEITYFVRDCIRKGNNFIGDNCRQMGVKPKHFSVKWTEDEVGAVFEDGLFTGWDKRVSDLTEAEQGEVINPVSRAEYRQAVKYRTAFAAMSHEQIAQFILKNMPGSPALRLFWTDVCQALLSVIKMMDSEK